MSDKPAPIQDESTGRFLPGNSGGPGKPKGARNKLGEAFIQALRDSFEEHGPETIEAVRTEKPDQYLKVIASLLPKEMTLNINDAESLSDDELIERIRELDAAIHPFLVGREGNAGEAGAGTVGAAIAPRVH
jgi:hypothetical protein